MKCDDCGKENADVTFKVVINNKQTTLHLCHACATQRGFAGHAEGMHQAHSFGVESLVSKIANEYEEESNAVTCSRCGLRYQEFKKSGRLGCGQCYNAFSTRLDDLLRKIHGANYHIGKMPKRLSPEVTQNRKVSALRAEMKKAVDTEDFEKAARIRDQLKQMGGEA